MAATGQSVGKGRKIPECWVVFGVGVIVEWLSEPGLEVVGGWRKKKRLWEEREGKGREAKDAAGQKPTSGDQLCRFAETATDHRNPSLAWKGRQAKDCRALDSRRWKSLPGFVCVIVKVGG